MQGQLPKISILVAARNEEANLNACLDSLLHLEYPTSLLDIWVGNDRSTDDTLSIAQLYAAKHSHIKVLDIQHDLGSARGKANVLAQLVQVSTGDLLLFTDADCTVNPLWAKALVSGAAQSGASMGIGVTAVKAQSLFEELQALDWLSAQGIMNWLSMYGLPVTLVGNNMFVDRQAYLETGGYQSMPHSVTEDYQLFSELMKRGKKFHTVWEKEALVETYAMADFNAWLSQHSRWLVGALKTPIWVKGLFFGQLVLVWTLIAFGFMGLTWVWYFLAGRYLFSAGISFSALIKIKKIKYWRGAFLYDFFFLITYPILLFRGLYKKKIEWKGREFKAT